MCAVSTLMSLRLINRAGAAGGGDGILEGGGKLRCGVGWDFVLGVARGVRFDIDSYIIE